MSCVPYTPNMACCDDWDSHAPDLQDRATVLAWASLRHLTGGRVGNCPVLVRPCQRRCLGTGSGPVFTPVLDGGRWYNVTCGKCKATDCACEAVPEVLLPGEVADVVSVSVDGVFLPEEWWRLDEPNRLVRTDGAHWPLCQDMLADPHQPGTFAVEYVPGVVPDEAGLWAAGVLACEFAKACTGSKCRLPSSVTSVARQGVSMEFTQGFFAGGVTGIREVDAYVLTVNPNRLAVPSKVWSPDLQRGRITRTVPMP